VKAETKRKRALNQSIVQQRIAIIKSEMEKKLNIQKTQLILNENQIQVKENEIASITDEINTLRKRGRKKRVRESIVQKYNQIDSLKKEIESLQIRKKKQNSKIYNLEIELKTLIRSQLLWIIADHYEFQDI
jgi:hypothetical protein